MNIARQSPVLKRRDLVVFVVFIVVSLGVWAVWMHRWNAQAARKHELIALYEDASGGDRPSVRRLAEYPSLEGTQLIEKLAQDRNALFDARLEAISLLGARHPIDSKALAPLLLVDQPFGIRRAATKVFKQSGCDEACMSATLKALHAIWGGQPTLEVQSIAQIPSPTLKDQEYLVYLHKQTEEDYFLLLNSNACLAGQTLNAEYAPESEFVDKIRKKLGHC